MQGHPHAALGQAGGGGCWWGRCRSWWWRRRRWLETRQRGLHGVHAAAEQVHVAADLVDHAHQGRQGEGAAGGLRNLGRCGGERPAGHRR